MAERPTSTSFALLGLLALQPWSAYELNQQMQRSLRLFWPRSAAHVYAEAKKLERLGYASAATTANGQRERTTYSITAAGRKALRSWLGTEPAEPLVEIEALVRILHADQGDREQLRSTIAITRGQMLQRYEAGADQVRGYLADGGPFPQRLHLIALLTSFYVEFAELVLDTCDRADAALASWPSTEAVGLTRDARAQLEAALAIIEARLATADQVEEP
jgi:PadR family transcriptional regulator AphA